MLSDICDVKLPNGFKFRVEVYGKDEVAERDKTLVLTLENEDFRRRRELVTRDFCLYSTVTLQHVVDSMLKEF